MASPFKRAINHCYMKALISTRFLINHHPCIQSRLLASQSITLNLTVLIFSSIYLMSIPFASVVLITHRSSIGQIRLVPQNPVLMLLTSLWHICCSHHSRVFYWTNKACAPVSNSYVAYWLMVHLLFSSLTGLLLDKLGLCPRIQFLCCLLVYGTSVVLITHGSSIGQIRLVPQNPILMLLTSLWHICCSHHSQVFYWTNKACAPESRSYVAN